MQLTAIFVSLGEPFDVPTEQYQFHSESIIDNEKVALEKELVRMLKPEDPSDHMNWETPEANGYELWSEHVIDMLKQLFQQLQTVQFRQLDMIAAVADGLQQPEVASASLVESLATPDTAGHPSGTEHEGQLWMHFHLPSTQKEFMSQPLQYIFWVLEYGGKDPLSRVLKDPFVKVKDMTSPRDSRAIARGAVRMAIWLEIAGRKQPPSLKVAKVSSPGTPPSGLSEETDEEVKTKEEMSSSPSSSTPPTATSATVTTATVPVLTRTGVKRAAENPPVDTGSRDPQDDDDAAMDEFCVLERFDKLGYQAARDRTSIEELEMKLKEEFLRLERDLERKLDESRQQLYKAHNKLSEILGRVTKHLTETILTARILTWLPSRIWTASPSTTARCR